MYLSGGEIIRWGEETEKLLYRKNFGHYFDMGVFSVNWGELYHCKKKQKSLLEISNNNINLV